MFKKCKKMDIFFYDSLSSFYEEGEQEVKNTRRPPPMESAVHLERNGKKVKENGHFVKRDYVCDFLFAFQYDAINLL